MPPPMPTIQERMVALINQSSVMIFIKGNIINLQLFLSQLFGEFTTIDIKSFAFYDGECYFFYTKTFMLLCGLYRLIKVSWRMMNEFLNLFI